jgi:hypothetical protein
VCEAPRRKVFGDREADRQCDSAGALYLLEGGGVALENALLGLGNSQIP